jgi:hypothetical protein
MEQAQTSGIMWFPLPHDHNACPWLPLHHSRSLSAWPNSPTTTRSATPDRFSVSAEATIRRTLARLDPDALARVIGAWLTDREGSDQRRRAVAVDGKTHLDLAGAVVTADALQTHAEAAEFLVAVKHAHYLLCLKANQPTLLDRRQGLAWHHVPVLDRTRDQAHGRVAIRTLKAVSVRGFGFPHAPLRSFRSPARPAPLAAGGVRPCTGRRRVQVVMARGAGGTCVSTAAW